MHARCARSFALALSALCIAGGARAELRVPDGAYAADLMRDGVPRLEARLLVHPDDVSASSVRIGALFDLAPGWHMYWRNPGQSGLPPELDWQLEGARIGPVAWPAPSRFWESDGEIETFGYAGRVLLASRVELAADAPAPPRVRLEAEVLVCNYECIPASVSLSRAIGPSGDADSDAATRLLFERFARAVPEPPGDDLSLTAVYSQSAIRPGDAFQAGILFHAEALRPASDAPVFFPDPPSGVELRPADVESHPDDAGSWLLVLEGHAGPFEPERDARLRGVLALVGEDGKPRRFEVDLPLPTADAGADVAVYGLPGLASSDAPDAAGGLGLLTALGLALLGGLVLNLMPCVLPVLAIKVFSVTELASQSRRDARRHGLAYAAGVLLTMAVLAGVVIALRAAGASVGWGFQFQEPLFVAAIAVLLVVFALNLFGVFEIGAPAGALADLGARASGARRSFFEGLLAVVLATPCTAPFLGTAVGFAFASRAIVILGIFAAIGAGLAAPFVLVTWVPGWARFLPRSGPWMLRFRSGLGFALLATVVWLVWVFGLSAGTDGVAALLGLLLAVAFTAWVYGILQAGRPRWLPWATVAAVAALALAATGLVGVERSAAPEADAAWAPYAPAAVAAELADGRPVFVTFTADWCITCKVNEKVVLTDERVQDELERLGYALFRADWTRRDEAIRTELARFGKAGVPLYLVYRPEAPERPVVLPELLTIDLVLDALRSSA